MANLRVGSRVCQCAACGEVFGGVESFDRHQRLRGGPYEPMLVCLPPAEVGLVRGKRGYWIQDGSESLLNRHQAGRLGRAAD